MTFNLEILDFDVMLTFNLRNFRLWCNIGNQFRFLYCVVILTFNLEILDCDVILKFNLEILDCDVIYTFHLEILYYDAILTFNLDCSRGVFGRCEQHFKFWRSSESFRERRVGTSSWSDSANR